MKNSDSQIEKNIARVESGILIAVLMECLLSGGGFFRLSQYLISALVLLGIMILVMCRKVFFIKWNTHMLFLIIMLAGALVTLKIGIDFSDSMYGVFRVLAMGLLWFLIIQTEEESRVFCIRLIPWIGLATTALAVPARLIPWIYDRMFSAGRWNGPFFYPNTTALFLLAGSVIAQQKESGRKRLILMTGLGAGILLTGSRTVFILTILYVIYRILHYGIKEKRKFHLGILQIIRIICLVIAAGSGICLLSGENMLKRIFSIGLNESTLQGRLLYWEDALPMIIRNPLGLGYMGYFYLQQELQTGVYSVRYVHNELLQCVLDFGILPAVMMTYLFLQTILERGTARWKKEIIILTALHCLVDFDLQFLAIVFLLFLLEEGKGKHVICVKKSIVILSGVIPVGVLCFFMTAEIFAVNGNYVEACRWIPWSTEYQTGKMLQSENLDEAAEMAERLISENSYLYVAYKILGNWNAGKGNVEEYAQNQGRVLSLRKYEIEEYEEYISVLADLYIRKRLDGKEAEAQKCISYLEQVPELLLDAKRSTSVRAYRIEEKPYLILDEEFDILMDQLLRTGGGRE